MSSHTTIRAEPIIRSLKLYSNLSEAKTKNETDVDANIKCSICTATLKEKDFIVDLDCGCSLEDRMIHKSCFTNWAKNKNHHHVDEYTRQIVVRCMRLTHWVKPDPLKSIFPNYQLPEGLFNRTASPSSMEEDSSEHSFATAASLPDDKIKKKQTSYFDEDFLSLGNLGKDSRVDLSEKVSEAVVMLRYFGRDANIIRPWEQRKVWEMLDRFGDEDRVDVPMWKRRLMARILDSFGETDSEDESLYGADAFLDEHSTISSDSVFRENPRQNFPENAEENRVNELLREPEQTAEEEGDLDDDSLFTALGSLNVPPTTPDDSVFKENPRQNFSENGEEEK